MCIYNRITIVRIHNGNTIVRIHNGNTIVRMHNGNTIIVRIYNTSKIIISHLVNVSRITQKTQQAA